MTESPKPITQLAGPMAGNPRGTHALTFAILAVLFGVPSLEYVLSSRRQWWTPPTAIGMVCCVIAIALTLAAAGFGIAALRTARREVRKTGTAWAALILVVFLLPLWLWSLLGP